MVSVEERYKIMCHDDCEMGGCPGHDVELHYQSTSDWFNYYKNGKHQFSMDVTEMNNLLRKIYELSTRFVYIKRPNENHTAAYRQAEKNHIRANALCKKDDKFFEDLGRMVYAKLEGQGTHRTFISINQS